MVKLTVSFIERKRAQHHSQKHLTKEFDKDGLKKITHLFMNDQCIDEIDDLSVYKNLRVIYLQKNSIERIENLNFATNLTHLYLQNNEILKIENLGNLKNLRKLYLGQNNISVVEGLQNLINLTELHIENQRLASGERLIFEPRTISTLSGSLQYLNISGNKFTSLSEIDSFQELITLEAKDNRIEDLEDLTVTISYLEKLANLFLQGNPVTKKFRYRESIIANIYILTVLDDKIITENSRTFLKKFRDEKFIQSQKKIEPNLSEDITNSLNLPPAFKRSVSRAMFQNTEPKFSFPGLSLLSDSHVFPAWTGAASTKSLKGNRVLPRQLWRNKNKHPSQKNQVPKQNSGLPTLIEINK